MRFFPSAPRLSRALDRLPAWARPQWLIAGLAVLATVAALAVPLAHADDDSDSLKDQQSQVKGKIANVKGHIHEASARVARISRKLEKIQGNLTRARADLKKVEGRLAKARKAADKLATRLVTAEQQLVVAKANLVAARTDVRVQRGESRDAIVNMATGQDPRLALVNSYFSSGSIEDILVSQTVYDLVTGRQAQALDAFEAAETAMETSKTEVKAARDGVAAAKKAADRNVARVAALVDRASVTESRVANLATRTTAARKDVIRARAADQAALRRLEKREARIKAKIIALSRKQSGSYNGDTKGLLARPGPGRVTSPFGYRNHPIYGYWGLHNGTDFGTGCGAALWAGEAGTVINTYYDEIYGNRLYLAIGKVNGASITLVYNHLSRYAVGEGTKVRRGQVVGYSGTTGWSTGCHLHFIVLRDGNPVDPMAYL